MNVFKSLTKVISDNNKQLHSSDVTELAKFDGHDSQWDDWYFQLRTYFEAEGWIATFEHPTSTVGFDIEINTKIYHKLLALCRKGTATIYVTKATNFKGWEAARFLLDRYEGFSKQRQRSLRQLIEQLRHVHGTNMSRHIDRSERICGQLATTIQTTPQQTRGKSAGCWTQSQRKLRLCPRYLYRQTTRWRSRLCQSYCEHYELKIDYRLWDIEGIKSL